MIRIHKELERLKIDHTFRKREDGLHLTLGTHHIIIPHPHTSIVRCGRFYEVYGNGSRKILTLIQTLKYVLSSRNR